MKFFNWLQDSWGQLVELAILIGALLLPFLLNFQYTVATSDNPPLDPLDLVVYYAVQGGNVYIGVVLFFMIASMFHRMNEGRTLNRGNRYHEHTMIWYWLCSKVLGYGTCSLVRVPIATQFKLVLDDTFDKYDFGDIAEEADEDAEIETSPSPNTTGFPSSSDQIRWVNLLISDTYPIIIDLLPDDCCENSTVIVRRMANKESFARRYSPKLVDSVTNVVRSLPQGSCVNVFATTNPKNTYEIINKVFKTGGRDNISALYVYKQQDGNSKDPWRFVKAVRIYDRY